MIPRFRILFSNFFANSLRLIPVAYFFTNIKVFQQTLDTIFSQCPLFRNKNEVITLSGIDLGSTWLTFTIVGGSAVAVLGGLAALIDKVIQIRSHALTLKEQEEELRRRRISNDLIEEAVSLHKKLVEQIAENAVKDLASSQDITCPEERERLKYTLKLLSDWMSKGMEIYASVKAPQEVKALFPAVEQQKLLTYRPKELQSSDGNTPQSEE